MSKFKKAIKLTEVQNEEKKTSASASASKTNETKDSSGPPIALTKGLKMTKKMKNELEKEKD